MNLKYISKLIGAITGNLVAIFLVWLALRVPSIGTCIDQPDGSAICSALGFSQAEITAAVMAILNSLFVYLFPSYHITAGEK